MNDARFGDEIGVFDNNGSLVGSAVYEGRHLAITVWGDDPTTDQIDGMPFGNDFNFRIWRQAEQQELTTTVQYAKGETAYQDGGVSILKKLEESSTVQSLNIYPNPTFDVVNLLFHSGVEEKISAKLVDLRGRELMRIEKWLAWGKTPYNLTCHHSLLAFT